MRYVIVGNSFAATFAVEAIRRYDRGGQITIVGEEKDRLYSRAMIHEYLAGLAEERLVYLRDEDFHRMHDVRLLTGRRATAIDVEHKYLLLDEGAEKLKYDKLLIATGARPFIPPGLEQRRNFDDVYTFTTLADARRIRSATERANNIVVLGAGLIGLQCAEALAHLGKHVAVVELAPRVLPTVLDEAAAAMVQQQLEQQNITFHLSQTIAGFLGSGRKLRGLQLKSGQKIPCELLVIAVGVRPNVEFLKDSGIEIDRGIIVDAQMQTNVKGIYAAGDCAQAEELTTGTKMVLPTIPIASQQGSVAGTNMAGVQRRYRGGIAMNCLQFGTLQIISYGLPQQDGEEVKGHDPRRGVYKRFILRDGKLVSAILVRAIDRAGIYRYLIERRINIAPLKQLLLRDDFGFIHLPRSLRDELFTVPQ